LRKVSVSLVMSVLQSAWKDSAPYVKQSRYRPGVAQRVPGRFPDFMTRAQDGGKVSLIHRPAITLGNIPCTYFC
jgi:hypothetical protein